MFKHPLRLSRRNYRRHLQGRHKLRTGAEGRQCMGLWSCDQLSTLGRQVHLGSGYQLALGESARFGAIQFNQICNLCCTWPQWTAFPSPKIQSALRLRDGPVRRSTAFAAIGANKFFSCQVASYPSRIGILAALHYWPHLWGCRHLRTRFLCRARPSDRPRDAPWKLKLFTHRPVLSLARLIAAALSRHDRVDRVDRMRPC